MLVKITGRIAYLNKYVLYNGELKFVMLDVFSFFIGQISYKNLNFSYNFTISMRAQSVHWCNSLTFLVNTICYTIHKFLTFYSQYVLSKLVYILAHLLYVKSHQMNAFGQQLCKF